MKIPKDFRSKPLPRQMAHAPQMKPSPGWSLRQNVIKICTVGIGMVICLVFVILLSVVVRDRRQTAELDADNVSITSTVADSTGTKSQYGNAQAKLPTATTITQNHTLTHTPILDNVQSEPIIQYVEVTRQVIVTRDVIVSATPQPTPKETHTPVPTPNATQTQAAVITRNQNRQDTAFTIGLFGLSISISLAMIFLAVRFGIVLLLLPFVDWLNGKLERPTLEDTEETRAEIVNPYTHPRYTDWRDRAWFLRKNGLGPSDIVKDLWPDNESGGGSQFYAVKRVLRGYDPLGEFGPTTPPPRADGVQNTPTT